jgi:hypothetical protein
MRCDKNIFKINFSLRVTTNEKIDLQAIKSEVTKAFKAV